VSRFGCLVTATGRAAPTRGYAAAVGADLTWCNGFRKIGNRCLCAAALAHPPRRDDLDCMSTRRVFIATMAAGLSIALVVFVVSARVPWRTPLVILIVTLGAAGIIAILAEARASVAATALGLGIAGAVVVYSVAMGHPHGCAKFDYPCQNARVRASWQLPLAIVIGTLGVAFGGAIVLGGRRKGLQS
jgi:hypothetical protein